MRAISRFVLAFAGLAAAAIAAAPSASAGDKVSMVVLKEHAVGNTSSAQPYLDKLMEVAAKQNGWASGGGFFSTSRSKAEAWIQSDKPRYGILSLAPFLAFKDKFNLEVIGQASVAGGGGKQYFIVSSAAKDLAGCKGKRLATDHDDDPKFIDKVVGAGAWKLGDFTVLHMNRTGEPGRKVVSNDADCALIDDAQLGALAKVDGGAAVKPVWSGKQLPSLVVVAFADAPAADRKAFQANMAKLCVDGKQACDEVGLTSLASASAATYADPISLYSK